MKYFQKISDKVDVAPLMEQLNAHPELWDANPLRRVYENSPHREMTDIWVRARASTGSGLTTYSDRHESVWWPAAKTLAAVFPMAFAIMTERRATSLGGILLTKIPGGGKIYPHNDRGFWHAEHYDTKVYVCLQGNDNCVTWCEDESVVMKTGEAWVFNNLVTHGLNNYGSTDRISAILALRTK